MTSVRIVVTGSRISQLDMEVEGSGEHAFTEDPRAVVEDVLSKAVEAVRRAYELPVEGGDGGYALVRELADRDARIDAVRAVTDLISRGDFTEPGETRSKVMIEALRAAANGQSWKAVLTTHDGLGS